MTPKRLCQRFFKLLVNKIFNGVEKPYVGFWRVISALLAWLGLAAVICEH
jgi:hypothetical protein